MPTIGWSQIYCHPDFDDVNFLDSYRGHPTPSYPERGSAKFDAGGDLNRLLRHCIGKVDRKTGDYPLRCDEGAWVLIEDIIQYDNIWHDGHDYCAAVKDKNRILANTIKKQRVGWVVDLTVAENSYKGKVGFQIQALRATSQEELTSIVNQKIIQPPIPGTDLLAPPYFGWIMPVAVRATSGHSVRNRVELKPELIMRLTLRTAFKLKGAFHVTSPTNLMSILKHGIVPGGEKQRRLMSFFGVFPPWDERNRVARTRSPNEGELHMLIIYIPPTELIRYGAGVSSTGDIMVPENIPPVEIREIWLARNCMSKLDDKGDRRWVITRPFKIFTRQLADEIVTYADVNIFEDLESLPQEFN